MQHILEVSVPARALPRRRHRGAEALQHGLPAHRDFRKERTTSSTVVLRDMVKQLALPVEIIPAETVRAEDGSRSARGTRICHRPSGPRPRASTARCAKSGGPCLRDGATTQNSKRRRWRSSTKIGFPDYCRDQEAIRFLQLPSPADRDLVSSGRRKTREAPLDRQTSR